MPDSHEPHRPEVVTSLDGLRDLVDVLDIIAAKVDSDHSPLGQLDGGVDEEVRRSALVSRARSCVVTVLQRGGRDNLHEAAIAIGGSLRGRRPAATPDTLWARLDELAQVPSAAAARVGPSTTEQALRGWNGKSRHVIDALAASPRGEMRRAEIEAALAANGTAIGDSSALSKILGELDDAGLIRRWKEGRQIQVELTPAGRTAARPLPPSDLAEQEAPVEYRGLIVKLTSHPDADRVRRAYRAGHSSVTRLAVLAS